MVSVSVHGFRQPPELGVKAVIDPLGAIGGAHTQMDHVRMVEIAADGAIKEYEFLQVIAMRGQERRALLRLLAPREMEGTMLFCIQEPEKRDDLYYACSTRGLFQKIEGQHKTTYFEESAWTYEDFLFMDCHPGELRLLGQQVFDGVLCNRFVADSPEENFDYRSMYGRRELLLTPEGTLRQVSMYDWDGHLVKTITYRAFSPRLIADGETVELPGRIEMHHHSKSTTVVLTFEQTRFGAPVPGNILTTEGIQTWSTDIDRAIMSQLAGTP